MPPNKFWSCKTCNWALGRVTGGKLQVFAQAIHGEGVGAIPEVRTVLASWTRAPVRCSHCGGVRWWKEAEGRKVAVTKDVTATKD